VASHKIASLILVDAAQFEMSFRFPNSVGDPRSDVFVGHDAAPGLRVHDSNEQVSDFFGRPVDCPNEERKLFGEGGRLIGVVLAFIVRRAKYGERGCQVDLASGLVE